MGKRAGGSSASRDEALPEADEGPETADLPAARRRWKVGPVKDKGENVLQATHAHIPRENAPRKTVSASPNADKLLDQLRQALRSRHYSRRTEQTYCHWVKRYVHFHNVL